MPTPQDYPGQRRRPPVPRSSPESLLASHEREKRRTQRPVGQDVPTPDLAGPPDVTVIRDTENLRIGGYDLDLATGHVWHLAIRGSWQGITAGGIFCSTISDGNESETPSTVILAADGARYHAWSTVVFGPTHVSAVATKVSPSDDSPGSDPYLAASLTATWLRAAVPSDFA